MAETENAKQSGGRIGSVSVNAGGDRDASQNETAEQLIFPGTTSATDRLLGLNLQPTAAGMIAPPPGNIEFLRHVSPPARRAIMRKMLEKQRERMRKLAHFLRDRQNESENESGAGDETRESFLEVIAEKMRSEEYNAGKNQILRARVELDKTARMLDILDEMLAMQDHTISRIGTFRQG